MTRPILSRRRVGSNRGLLIDGGEAEHLHLNFPKPIGQTGYGIETLLVGDCGELFAALAGCNCYAGHWQTVELNLPAIVGCEQRTYG